MARVVVLVGAPGSGKSTVGALLGASGLRWRDWEPIILERWGSRESFVAAKAEALPLLHREIRSWIDEDGPAAVVESTAFRDFVVPQRRCDIVIDTDTTPAGDVAACVASAVAARTRERPRRRV